MVLLLLLAKDVPLLEMSLICFHRGRVKIAAWFGVCVPYLFPAPPARPSLR